MELKISETAENEATSANAETWENAETSGIAYGRESAESIEHEEVAACRLEGVLASEVVVVASSFPNIPPFVSEVAESMMVVEQHTHQPLLHADQRVALVVSVMGALAVLVELVSMLVQELQSIAVVVQLDASHDTWGLGCSH